MKLYLFYEGNEKPMQIEIPDHELDGFLQEFEEALADTSVQTFQWKGSSFRIGGLMAIVQEKHLVK
jgi:hypothetical protein